MKASRDAPLSLRWETAEHWSLVNAAMGHPRGSEALAATAIALTVEALGAGRRVSYSRARDHYNMPRGYRSRLYTYSRVVGAADTFDASELIEHDRVPPGNRGRQSCMKGRPELIRLVQPVVEAVLVLRKPVEPVILRDSDKKLLDYGETRTTRQMRREVEAQNEAITSAKLGGGNVLQFVAPLRRIFNDDFSRGGRFYAEGRGWQSLHVHVHAGGQAVFGAVEAGGRDQAKEEEQPDAIAHAPEPPLWGEDAARQPVPVSGDEERTLPDARREVARPASRE